MIRRAAVSILAGLCLSGCGAGVPITVIIDDVAMDISLERRIDELEELLRMSGVPGTETLDVPATWPLEFAPTCVDLVFETDPDVDGGRVDLSPDPEDDPEAAEQFKALEDGTVTRMDILDVVLRVERNDLGSPLPPLEIRASSNIASPLSNRPAWRQIGRIGDVAAADHCRARDAAPPVLDVDELGDLPVELPRGSATFLRDELIDPECTMKCRELAISVRARFPLRLEPGKPIPLGSVRLRPIIVATFFVDLF